MRLLSVSQTARLRVYAETVLVNLRTPGAVEATDGEIALHERLLTRGAEPRLVARLVIVQANAGRIADSIRTADRLRVFHAGNYEELRALILEAVEHLGATADPLRLELAAGSAAVAAATP
jgi:hypothetical protein